ncbi:HEPN domain-containing protein [Vibrio gazogenes]|uniref:Nucleotidyltransferase domain-containing protein n=1 Tax=Vibrio gazogenes DSM 21264 = NBRC 103151 TaxID=1123492 RepID=A0A1M4SAN1_VIBGA|nr:HEPN domain-containing protein [Vibrio gazogenes]USP15813.1 HEPN domain-containing protein [Vibrio gazogenes]SHE29251.1 Nucleotidyltransferase domain-containing protein [Vibrio gazogenes DSM 21264] [Vibrio gazogenes DSM 21264 = NBRC 103151]SJN59358.1 HEPN domain protein [Vibrio gazogenes]
MKTSLDHLPEYKQQELATISTILRDTLDDYLEGKTGSKSEFRILKIILFGSYAKGNWVRDPVNGYISDYDILVIVNKSALVEDYVVWQRAEEQIDRKVKSAPLGLIVHDLQEVNERLQQGHYFFKDIREEGIELFAATPKPLIEPGDLTEAEKRAIARKHYAQWFKSANAFITGYHHYLNQEELSIAAFELHQSTERFLACVLLTCTNYLPKSHNIEKLSKLCAQIEPEFKMIFPLDNKFHRRSFRRLQRAYIEARYSEHYEITVEELAYLEGRVLQLKALVERVCLARID